MLDSPHPPTNHSGGHILSFIGRYLKQGCLSSTPYTPCLSLIPTTSLFPYSPIQTVPSLESTHTYLIGLTFSLGPDEAATVRWLQKLVCDLNALIALFQQSRWSFNMDTNKISNIFKYLLLSFFFLFPSLIFQYFFNYSAIWCLPFWSHLVSSPFMLLSAALSIYRSVLVFVLSFMHVAYVSRLALVSVKSLSHKVWLSNCLVLSSSVSIFLSLESWSLRYISNVIGITSHVCCFLLSDTLYLSCKDCMFCHYSFGPLFYYSSMVLQSPVIYLNHYSRP